jgi:hypothetical protein
MPEVYLKYVRESSGVHGGHVMAEVYLGLALGSISEVTEVYPKCLRYAEGG